MEDNISYLIYRISSDKFYFQYKDAEFYLLTPNPDVKYRAEILYNSIIEDDLYDDWPRKESMGALLFQTGLWSSKDEQLLKQIEKSIENMKVSLYTNRNDPKRVKSARKDLDTYKQSLNAMYNKKYSLDYTTLDFQAAIRKQEFIIQETLYYSNTNKKAYGEDSDIEISDIVSIINKNAISVEQFKKIARSDIWKSIWNCGKNNVFGKLPIELSDEQKTLINLSIIYDRIYENPECPPESVINDDDMLDGWMIHQKREMEKQKKENEANGVGNKHGNAKEVFIVANRDEASDIIGLNSAESQNIIKQRESLIKSNEDGVSVASLPDVQMDLLRQKSEMNRIRR